MQKLSGILPSSARITAVDMKGSGAARPGSPSFGRPVGESNLEKNAIVRHAHRALKRHRELMETRSPEDNDAAIVRNLSDGFFNSQAQRATSDALVDSILADEMAKAGPAPQITIPNDEGKISVDDFASSEFEVDQPLSEEEMNSPEVGRYLDVSA